MERLVLASSIVTAPTRKELAIQAATIIRVEFENAVLALCQHPSFDHADLSPAQVAKLLSNLLELSTPETPILDGPQRQALIAAAQAKYGTEVVAPILQQIIPRLRSGGLALIFCCANHMPFSISLPTGTTLVQAFNQLGPDITSDAEAVRALMHRFGISEANPPTDSIIIEYMVVLARLAADGSVLGDVGSFVRAISSFVSTLFHEYSSLNSHILVKCRQLG